MTTLDSEKQYTSAELRRMPPIERDAILSAAAERALEDYTNDDSLTDFEAFGREDMYGSSSNASTR